MSSRPEFLWKHSTRSSPCSLSLTRSRGKIVLGVPRYAMLLGPSPFAGRWRCARGIYRTPGRWWRLDGSAQGQDWPLRMARRERPVSAVGDEVERFEHELPDQDLAPGRSHDGLGPRGEVPDLDRDVCHWALFPPLVCVDDCGSS